MLTDDVRRCFGEPRQYSSMDAWRSIEESAGSLPEGYKEFCSAYGPGVIGKFLKILHPDSVGANLGDAISNMAPLHQELYPEKIPHQIHPFTEGGAVLWALSSQSDALFLVPYAHGEWRIGVWFRQWAEWEEYTDEIPDWLVRQVVGELIIPGLPLRVHGGFVPLD